jgi:hypothetical protein
MELAALPADKMIELKGQQKDELCQDADVESEVRLLKESSRQGREARTALYPPSILRPCSLPGASSDCPLLSSSHPGTSWIA